MLNPSRKKGKNGGRMKISDLWNVGVPLENILRARTCLREHPEKCFSRKDGSRACLVAALASSSHRQDREIAEAFGLEYDDLLMNEKEMEHYRRQLEERTRELLADLSGRVLVPAGYSFSFGYEPGGNFGLLLERAPGSGEEKVTPAPKEAPPLFPRFLSADTPSRF
jgi:hypothetical protein